MKQLAFILVLASTQAFAQDATNPGTLRIVKLQKAYSLTKKPPALGGLQTGMPDRWWRDPSTAQSLGLTADQQQKMDDVFQPYRLKLIDLNASLEKEEITLEPLVAADQPDEGKIATEIDRVAQARAELEKANGRMLLGIRKILTQDQWSKLQTEPRGSSKLKTKPLPVKKLR
jgi:Spy/CpxP family protein refolding chaperone